MTEQAKQAKREYYKKWREDKANKGKTKLYQERYWEKKALQMAEEENREA